MLTAMLPRLHTSKLVSGWIWATLAASIIAAVDGGWLHGWAALAPSRIWRGELWRIVTWALIEGGAWNLCVVCACIYKFGGELAGFWGDRRLRRFMLEVIAGAAVITALAAMVSDDIWYLRRVGGWAVDDALVIAWARQFPDRTLQLYGTVRLHGRQLIAVTIAVTAVYALFRGPLAMLPELVVCAAVYWYPGAWLARRA
jgi:membrane associated rhomboid family serine protease